MSESSSGNPAVALLGCSTQSSYLCW